MIDCYGLLQILITWCRTQNNHSGTEDRGPYSKWKNDRLSERWSLGPSINRAIHETYPGEAHCIIVPFGGCIVWAFGLTFNIESCTKKITNAAIRNGNGAFLSAIWLDNENMELNLLLTVSFSSCVTTWFTQVETTFCFFNFRPTNLGFIKSGTMFVSTQLLNESS